MRFPDWLVVLLLVLAAAAVGVALDAIYFGLLRAFFVFVPTQLPTL